MWRVNAPLAAWVGLSPAFICVHCLAPAETREIDPYARNNLKRQEFLLKRGVASRATFNEATEPSMALLALGTRICHLWASHTLTGIDDGYSTQLDMTTSSLTNSPSGGGPEGIDVGPGGHATLALMATKFLGAASPGVGSNPCDVHIATWLAMTLLE